MTDEERKEIREKVINELTKDEKYMYYAHMAFDQIQIATEQKAKLSFIEELLQIVEDSKRLWTAEYALNHIQEHFSNFLKELTTTNGAG